MKFNFIIPSWSYWQEPIRAQPLTSLYLATILRNEHHEVEITDMRTGYVEPNDADAFLYTVASPDFKEVSNMVTEFRKFKKAKHIAGGPHPSIFPNESSAVFDSVVVGHGEEAVKEIGNNLAKGFLQSVYYFKAEGEYPFPERDFLPRERIVTSLFKTMDIPSTTALFSHNCPFSCSFCANYTKSPVKRRSIESLEAEIDYLRTEYGIRGLSLQDEICIPPNNGQANEFLLLMARSLMYWRGQTRGGTKESVLEQASRSGCVELSFGLESVDQRTLDFTNKRMKVDIVKDTLRMCQKYGIKTRLYLLNGLPGEPNDIVDKTKRFIDETKPDVVLLSTLQPYPGSDIHDHPDKYGIEWIDTDYSKYNHLRGRFKDSIDNPEEAVPFKYKEGQGFTRERIVRNLQDLQGYLIERGLNK